MKYRFKIRYLRISPRKARFMLANFKGQNAVLTLERLAAGNPGDVKAVGEGVSELRINCGPGYRVYYKKHGRKLIILLAGGDKRTQAKDIKTALRLAQNL